LWVLIHKLWLSMIAASTKQPPSSQHNLTTPVEKVLSEIIMRANLCIVQVCATKKVCRYHPAEVKQGMAALARAQEQLQATCAAAWQQLLQDFTAAHHAAFRAAVGAVAQLDALHSLAVVAASPGYCKPEVSAAAMMTQRG
jgi:DNA mismatch repair ATPase MutS